MHTTSDPAAWRQALTAYTQFSDFLLCAVDGVPLGVTHADRLSRVAWLLAVEDASALGVLIEKRLLGSARPLIRPQFESLVRGTWALQCTDEAGLQAIVDDAADFPMLGKAVAALMDAPAPFTLLKAPVPFHELDRRSRDAMNDHTHRGMRALARRTHALGLDSGSIDDDEYSLFHLGTSVGGIAAAALLERSGRSSEARVVIGRLQLTAALWEPLPADPPANPSD
jgi:hypothetical protein